MAQLKCKHCGAVANVPAAGMAMGMRLQPYAGGGEYGICFKCKRSGGQEVINIPQKPVKKPVGWHGVPGGGR